MVPNAGAHRWWHFAGSAMRGYGCGPLLHDPMSYLVLDPSILRLVDVSAGLKAEGILITNTRFSPEEIKKELGVKTRLATVDANRIAREELGLPITNTTMLGALLKASEVVAKESLIEPLQERFGRLAERNIKAFERAYRETKVL